MASIGSGKAPPREIVRLARHLHAKHPEDPAYEWWSSLGGASLTNVERDLHRRSKPWTSKALEPFVIPLTLESDHDGAYTAQWATLAPYEVFHAIYEAGPQFEVSFLGADGPPWRRRLLGILLREHDTPRCQRALGRKGLLYPDLLAHRRGGVLQ